MSYTFLKWDKVSNINNCPAKDYLDNHPEINESDEIVLVSENGAVCIVLNTTHMRAGLGLADNAAAEVVAEAHMNKVSEDNTKGANDLDTSKKDISDIQFVLMVGGLL